MRTHHHPIAQDIISFLLGMRFFSSAATAFFSYRRPAEAAVEREKGLKNSGFYDQRESQQAWLCGLI